MRMKKNKEEQHMTLLSALNLEDYLKNLGKPIDFLDLPVSGIMLVTRCSKVQKNFLDSLGALARAHYSKRDTSATAFLKFGEILVKRPAATYEEVKENLPTKIDKAEDLFNLAKQWLIEEKLTFSVNKIITLKHLFRTVYTFNVDVYFAKTEKEAGLHWFYPKSPESLLLNALTVFFLAPALEQLELTTGTSVLARYTLSKKELEQRLQLENCNLYDLIYSMLYTIIASSKNKPSICEDCIHRSYCPVVAKELSQYAEAAIELENKKGDKNDGNSPSA